MPNQVAVSVKIQQWYYHADNVEHKTKLLARIISEFSVERAIVFVRRREDVRELSETLRKREFVLLISKVKWLRPNVTKLLTV